ncbi:nuclear transport factor 2 family protein [Salarchaeum sp. III]|uniref:nuclear transport factor 2 family protein n=1 Tax=Salarchaeum sp. III TaxID=3107927 RepID=UPI002ED99A91
MNSVDLAHAYYDAIDAGDYEALRDVLAPDFTHVRPDRTLAGREEFVSFMRDDRPQTDTKHVVDSVTEGVDGAVAHGHLFAPEEVMFAFVDVFETDERIERLRTYAD